MSQGGPVQVHSSKHFGPGQDFEFDRLRSRVPQKIKYLRSNLLTGKFYFVIIILRSCLIRHRVGQFVMKNGYENFYSKSAQKFQFFFQWARIV